MTLHEFANDDICALGTAAGHSAIAVVRLSGPNALSILIRLTGRSRQNIKSHKAFLSFVYGATQEKIDQTLITFFEDKRSYTGEASFEVSCHGSTHIIQRILERLVELGARSAERGEFTFRAFLNGKIDLVQAESVLTLIESQSDHALRISLRQLEGRASENFKRFESDIIWCLAHIEASIDFSTEGLDVINDDVLIQKLTGLVEELKMIALTYRAGRFIRDGVKVALIGKPNVGKSSLLNLLVQFDKAIVTPIAGTTRDIIESSVMHHGIKILLSDTAGLRETADEVERLGVARSRAEISKSDVNVLIFDANFVGAAEIDSLLEQIQNSGAGLPLVVLFNKVDLLSQSRETELREILQVGLQKIPYFSKLSAAQVTRFVSARDTNCRYVILDLIMDQFKDLEFLNEAVISSARQVEMVGIAIHNLSLAIQELKNGLGSEFIAQTLKEALLALQKLLGEVYDDQILDRVFKEFCLGK